ncbi:fimbria/pilus outer membrane usher protein [Moellerella wisconsensis]|uniref:fimbria/pilus outer membrane usher protein n=2 Tax=Moellerella wisconsensis TaxID=158849 RepID=UPI0024114782|nr:fimbria/pilus outer membrane usher protein [Moellerella wisconsensis]
MRMHPVTIALFPFFVGGMLVSTTPKVFARDYFDPALLSLGGNQTAVTDLSAFETAGRIPPGTYLVTLMVNQQDFGQHKVTFITNEKDNVIPELTPAFLGDLGVNIAALPAFSDLPTDKPVGNLAAIIPDAQVYFNFAQQRLELSIPQIAMKANARGYVDPSLWDDGIPALLLNYILNGGHNHQNNYNGGSGSDQTNIFGSLRGGLNWQAWRLRSDMTYMRSRSSGDGHTTNNQTINFSNTYLQRDIKAWRSDVLVGENNTGNEVFDSIPFRGIKLSSSEDMIPVSLRGFAPVITGIAQSNARVTVTQNGNVVYQTYVPPGPFRISDLYQSGQGGNLTITVNEADGSVRTWTQAVSSLPVMQRPGGFKYELTAGRYNGGITTGSRKANFALGSLIYGLPHNITLYGGSLLAKDYASVVGGTGISLGALGALSADVTHSSAVMFNDQRQTGQSYRVRYAKSLLSTGTSIDLSAYRYSTRHYYSFADFNNTGYQLNEGQVPWALERQRSDFQIRLSQDLGEWGSVYMTGSRSDYWGNQRVNNSLSVGYNTNIRGVSLGLAYRIDRIKSGDKWPQNRQLAMNLQVPFSLFSPEPGMSRTYASYQMTHDSDGRVQQQAGVSGSAMDDRLSYNVMQSWGNDSNSENNISTLNLGWQGSQGMANLGYSHSSRYNSLNMAGSGGVLIHPYGITFSQQMGNQVALVSAPDAGNVSVMNGGVSTNNRGYAVVPYLSAYQNNTVTLNSATLPDNVDLPQSSVNVYPTKGAVVAAKFATKMGYQALLTLIHDNDAVPFGTVVTVNTPDNSNSSIAGDGGQVYLSGLPEIGRLTAVWGSDTSQRCEAEFNLSNAIVSENNPVRMLTVHCEEK